MSINLHSGPEERLPDLYALWSLFTFGVERPLTTPTGERISAVIRATAGQDLGERIRLVAAAAEREFSGTWTAICHAGIDRIDAADMAHKVAMREGRARAESLQSEAMRKAMLQQLAARHEKHVRGNIADTLGI